jgi:hypothetical protein
MADRRTKRQAHPDVTPAFSYTLVVSTEVPTLSGQSGGIYFNTFPPCQPISPNLPHDHSLNYAKQTQFPKLKNQRKHLFTKDLPQYSTPPCPEKTNPIKPNLSRRIRNKPNQATHNTLHAVRFTLHACPVGGDTIYDIPHPTYACRPPRGENKTIDEPARFVY